MVSLICNGLSYTQQLERDEFQIVHLTPCSRCGGTGYFQEYRHIDNGICFRCKGNRFEEFVVEELSEYFDEL